MIIVALGANLPSRFGTPDQTLNHVLRRFPECGMRVIKASKLYSNPAIPPSGQPDFVNAAAVVATTAQPAEIIALCLALERELGRERGEKWGPRTVDLDLIDYEGRLEATSTLTLPHPRAHERAFVLVPLLEIAPNWRHPVSGESGWTLLDRIDPALRAAVKPLALQ